MTNELYTTLPLNQCQDLGLCGKTETTRKGVSTVAYNTERKKKLTNYSKRQGNITRQQDRGAKLRQHPHGLADGEGW